MNKVLRGLRRFNCLLSPASWQALTEIAALRWCSLTEAFRFAIGLTYVLFREQRLGNKVQIQNTQTDELKEIVIP